MDDKAWIDGSRGRLMDITSRAYNEDIRAVAQARWDLQLRAANPLWSHVRAQPFEVQAENGAAHVIALIDRRLPDLGLLGFFGADTPALGAAVLHQACDWLGRRGLGRAYGPINGTITYDYRFNIKDDYQIPGEPVNPAWYPDAWRAAGFKTFNRYVSGLNHFPTLFNKLFIQQPSRPGLMLRAAEPSRAEDDLRSYHDLMNDIFPHQSLYCPVLSYTERSYNLNGGKGAFDPRYCFFLEADGSDAGFIVAHPHQGRLVIKTLGVSKAYRGQRLSGLLIHRVQDQANRDGLKGAVYSTIRVGNAIYRMRRPGVRLFRQYVSLSRAL
jgi:hypothetical protein